MNEPNLSDTANNSIPEKPSREFAIELLERVRRHGWTRDYTETFAFAKWICNEAGVVFTGERPEPFEFDEE